MRTIWLAFISAVLAGCAGASAMDHATAVCLSAGYQQSDADFPACVQDNMRLARAVALRRSLERATPTQVPQRTYFEGMSYERDYHY